MTDPRAALEALGLICLMFAVAFGAAHVMKLIFTL